MESELPGHHTEPTKASRATNALRLSGWAARILAICASGVVFLLTALVLMTASLSAVGALMAAAAAASLTAAVFVMVWPATGWRAGLWASAAFLVYFLVAAIAYAVSGRPDWHPAFAAFVVAAAACLSAAFVARLLVRSRNQDIGGMSQ
jgi:hypothetical protein